MRSRCFLNVCADSGTSKHLQLRPPPPPVRNRGRRDVFTDARRRLREKRLCSASLFSVSVPSLRCYSRCYRAGLKLFENGVILWSERWFFLHPTPCIHTVYPGVELLSHPDHQRIHEPHSTVLLCRIYKSLRGSLAPGCQRSASIFTHLSAQQTGLSKATYTDNITYCSLYYILIKGVLT